jgi:hypothetical protein
VLGLSPFAIDGASMHGGDGWEFPRSYRKEGLEPSHYRGAYTAGGGVLSRHRDASRSFVFTPFYRSWSPLELSTRSPKTSWLSGLLACLTPPRTQPSIVWRTVCSNNVQCENMSAPYPPQLLFGLQTDAELPARIIQSFTLRIVLQAC